jgi:hypothetical protein
MITMTAIPFVAGAPRRTLTGISHPLRIVRGSG